MNYCDDMAVKRSVLLGARIRFSPSGASVRNQAIERIIEQNLASADTAKGLTEQELQNLATVGGQIKVLRAVEVRQGIDSLSRSKRVIEIEKGRTYRYSLSEAALNEVKQVITESEERTRDTIRDLFSNAPGGQEGYRRAFLQLLCLVFSRLSEVYVLIITMKRAGKDFVEHRLLASVLEEVLKSERVPDKEAFRYAVNRFFRESSPQFDQIKWNMAQSFYIAKALGIDATTDILSSDMFRDASLFCDTNVLIAGLTPKNRHHNSFRELAKACKAIGMSLKAAHATLEELRGVILAHATLLKKVFDKIPGETQPKVRNFLLEAFLAEREDSPKLSLEDFIERYQEPLKTLHDSFGLGEEDDQWFDDAPADQNTKMLAKELSKQYEEMRRRPKHEKAAVHDAVLFQWVARENINNRKSWIVTLDMTLAEWNVGQRMEGFNVITLDALLQWITPLVPGSADENRLAEIFSEAIRYQLFPKDTFFQLRDFQVFAEMGIETKQLPADDVEACIREIRRAGQHLDPSKAEDREKLGQVIQRYFADPGTKFKRTIEELQTRSGNLSKELAEEKSLRINAEKRVEELESHRQKMSREIEDGQRALDDASSRIKGLECRMQQQETAAHHKRLVGSAIKRTIFAIVMLVAIEAILGYFVWRFGGGQNFLQKATSASWIFGVGFGIVVIAYPFIMGRERMKLLKWWKGEID